VIDLARHAARELRKIGVSVDWRATFEEFVKAHGGLPVKHAGRLLFEDGWSHALNDYRGPAFPPPDPKAEGGLLALLKLKLAYQAEKRRKLELEREWLTSVVLMLREMQAGRGSPIMQRVRSDKTDELGNPRWEAVPVGGPDGKRGVLAALEGRLRSLTLPELADCKARIEQLEAEQRKALHGEEERVKLRKVQALAEARIDESKGEWGEDE
jgi:hypothetical protein